ncbi:DUF397 domain-containing protein [Streptomyces orinoci]|uniref:DUF397 domain-containing protein n=1 Tax=Streptomyces orinoci TaxID=67339 RepID=A0ABV3JY93_STRON
MRAESARRASNCAGGSGARSGAAVLAWAKPSCSGTGGGNCVDVAIGWRKSSYSGTSGGECVEVRSCTQGVHIRDSKRIPGPQLTVPVAAWAALVALVGRA